VRSNYGYVLAVANLTLAEVLRDAGYVTAAEIASPAIGRRTQLDQGFAHYRDPDSHGVQLKSIEKPTASGSKPKELPERDAADITRRGIEFLVRKRERPFFLWLHYFDPHVAYAPPPAFPDRFPRSRYHAEVAFTDDEIGRVVSELERLGLAQRTLLVLTSDHGEGLGEHGEKTHSFLVYDSTIRVPLILWGPADLARGRRIDTLVRTVDIAPTVLDWVGLPGLRGIQGVSLRPLLGGEPWRVQLTAYGESLETFATFGTSVLRFVREGRWKYIHKVKPELYDIESDPGELRNRAAAEAGTVARLRARLGDLLSEALSRVAQSEVEIDPETLAQLNALGYVGSSSRPGIDDELAELELGGPDPVETLGDIERFMAGWAALGAPDYAKAEPIFRELSARYPESLPILNGRTRVLLSLGRFAEATPLLRRGLELFPNDAKLLFRLATIMRMKGDLVEAGRLLRGAVTREPCGEKQRSLLANLLAAQKRYAEQMAVLADGTERCPGSLTFRNEYAHALATCPDKALRDGLEALRIAREITSGEGAANPAFLETLAVAYAENGEFEKASEATRRAIAVRQSRETADEAVDFPWNHPVTFEPVQPIREP
jgi:tetratricopeptide (TPR) repeat protein